ncbi:hypothetical protein AMTR_s00028p00229290 [Amborella trichopoda]|uniref:Uncharacterized protein n=1 Tax=Amborella trichopoda TaxID=13333 RepID=W1PRL5_AMBTC|nr:hypothetical protein AMTR_s00028p00229290 [Amborella trichopoda]
MIMVGLALRGEDAGAKGRRGGTTMIMVGLALRGEDEATKGRRGGGRRGIWRGVEVPPSGSEGEGRREGRDKPCVTGTRPEAAMREREVEELRWT